LDGELLSFRFDNGLIVDEQTGTVWNVLGQGTEGSLTGAQLEPIVGVNHFWFSWAAFKPETRVYEPAESTQSPADSESTEADALPEGSTGTSMEEVEPPPVVVDQLEVDFEIRVYQGDETLGGEQVLFSEILARGKPVVMEFWAGQCPVCRRSLPEVQEVYRELGDEATFVALDVGVFTGLGDEVAARALIADLGLTFPAGTIADPTPMQTYRVTGIPTTLFFKPSGELFSRGGGLVGVEALKEQVSALIAASEL
jgi:thiol-disulfide isomerase/thioredoxin